MFRTTTEDERSDKYHRLLAASLQSFSMFLSALSEDQLQEIADKFRPLLTSGKFWKFGKHTVGAVSVVSLNVFMQKSVIIVIVATLATLLIFYNITFYRATHAIRLSVCL